MPKNKSSKDEIARNIGNIRARLAVYKLKLSGLERQTKWLNEKEEARKIENEVSS